MNHRIALILLLLTLALASPGGLAAGPVQGLDAPTESRLPRATVRVGVTMVTVGVRVTGRQGREVQGLKVDDFSVYEDDVLQELAFFSEEDQPISLGILLDRSGSMGEGDKLTRAKMAALYLEQSGHPDNEFLYVPFDHRVEGEGGFTADRKQVELAIIGTGLGGGTSLYDAIVTTLDRFTQARHARQALVVITDGADVHSLHNLAGVIARVQASQVQLFLIGYFSQREVLFYRNSPETLFASNGETTRIVDNPWVVFKRLAQETGAESLFPQTDRELKESARAITDDLRHQYTLAYYPSNSIRDGRYRAIQVKVRRHGMKVRARQGYRLLLEAWEGGEEGRERDGERGGEGEGETEEKRIR